MGNTNLKASDLNPDNFQGKCIVVANQQAVSKKFMMNDALALIKQRSRCLRFPWQGRRRRLVLLFIWSFKLQNELSKGIHMQEHTYSHIIIPRSLSPVMHPMRSISREFF